MGSMKDHGWGVGEAGSMRATSSSLPAVLASLAAASCSSSSSDSKVCTPSASCKRRSDVVSRDYQLRSWVRLMLPRAKDGSNDSSSTASDSRS